MGKGCGRYGMLVSSYRPNWFTVLARKQLGNLVQFYQQTIEEIPRQIHNSMAECGNVNKIDGMQRTTCLNQKYAMGG